MRKKLNKGFTLLEVLISIVLFSIVIGLFIFVETTNYKDIKQHEMDLDQTIFLDNCYQLFSIDPINFKCNLQEAYKGKWDNFIYYPEILTNLEVRHYDNEEFIHVFILYDGKVLEEWVRQKVIQL